LNVDEYSSLMGKSGHDEDMVNINKIMQPKSSKAIYSEFRGGTSFAKLA
jgi:hypothetical protein